MTFPLLLILVGLVGLWLGTKWIIVNTPRVS